MKLLKMFAKEQHGQSSMFFGSDLLLFQSFSRTGLIMWTNLQMQVLARPGPMRGGSAKHQHGDH